ncbi:ethanolamine utilization microcompartment protein EutL [Brachyspira pilosicoli]|uniref:ethanolamine utilization microcompartment protein EutL n=1 Tax=Brachyspira pilosicoli TaxID=52584 RepID=UPI003005A30F
MRDDSIKVNILAVKMITNVDKSMAEQFKLDGSYKSLGLITTDCDDVGYTAIDEATKKADVKVAYARSMYAGASNASQKYAGEFIGILAGPSPAEVRSGLNAAIDFINSGDATFKSANEDDSVAYYAYTISRTGSYLSEQAGIALGSPLAYLVAPPLEAMYAIDAALKAADVKLAVFGPPPSETNFASAFLTGEQSACKAACMAFAEAVKSVCSNPTLF